MSQTFDMVSLLTDTKVLDTPDLSTESPLFEKYPLLVNIIESTALDTLTYVGMVVHIAVRIAPMITLCVALYAAYQYHTVPEAFVVDNGYRDMTKDERISENQTTYCRVMNKWIVATLILLVLSGDLSPAFLTRLGTILNSVGASLYTGWSRS